MVHQTLITIRKIQILTVVSLDIFLIICNYFKLFQILHD